MFSKKLVALAIVSALGLSVSAAQAAGFDHRDSGFHQTARYDNVRHGHHVKHHRHHNRQFNRGFR